MGHFEDMQQQPDICDYEGSDYQTRFWELGGREYEDACETLALRKLLPKQGDLLLEIGAGAGRNTPKYTGFKSIVLHDFSKTQLLQAKERLGNSKRYIYVVSDVYRLPFIDNLFDAATMIRVLHHMVDAPSALDRIRKTLKPGSIFILEYANKRNLKAVLRYATHKQIWNPFSLNPYEFAPLNFNFHPHHVEQMLSSVNLKIQKIITVSHFRVDFLKRHIPIKILLMLESLFQWTGLFAQLTPSVFLLSKVPGNLISNSPPKEINEYFICPDCGKNPLINKEKSLYCSSCAVDWPIENGMYIFKK